MKLTVMFKPAANGQLMPVLCDEQGEPLPGQRALAINTAIEDVATVTVTFGEVAFVQREGESNIVTR